MAWTLSTSGAAIVKAGANANSSIIISGATLLLWSNEAEAVLSTLTRYDWVANYSNVKTNFKQILSDVVASMIAKNIINYDMSGYTSRTEAQTMLDVLNDNINKRITDLLDDSNKEVMLTVP